MATPSLDDIAAMRAQGDDFAEYLRLITGGAPKPQSAKAPAAATDYGPLHRPGTWPAGTRPAGPGTCHPDCGCALTTPPQGSTA